MKKNLFLYLFIIATSLFIFSGFSTRLSSPEKAIKLYYKSISEHNIEKLEKCTTYNAFDVREKNHDCKISYKIIYKHKINEKEAGGAGNSLEAMPGDVKIITLDSVKCRDEKKNKGIKSCYWLRKIEGNWKIYASCGEGAE